MSTQAQTPEASSTAEMGQVSKEDASQFLSIYGDNPQELILPKDIPESDYLAYGQRLGQAMEFGAWRLGDWVNYGLGVYAYKDYEKMSAVTGFTEDFLRTCSSVAGRINGQYRLGLGLEKARLMLARKNDKETVPKLLKRLGKKTHAELREMGKSGGGGKKKKTSDKEGVTATELYEAATDLADMLEHFDTNTKLPALIALESDKETGGRIAQIASFLKALKDQLDDHPRE